MDDEKKVIVEVVETKEVSTEVVAPKVSLFRKGVNLIQKNWKQLLVGTLVVGTGVAGYEYGKKNGKSGSYEDRYSDDNDSDDSDVEETEV